MPWFDCGVNLDDKRIQKHFDTIKHHCIEQDVTHWLAIGTDLHSSIKNITAINELDLGVINISCSAGFHPHYADNADDASLHSLASLAQKDEVVAIGECGLDFNRNFSSLENQLKAFEWQLALAVDLQKPVYLHERDAFSQQVSLLEKYAHKLKNGVIHCFTGSPEQLQVYLDLGLYVGVTGWVCDPERGESLRQAATTLPLNRLLLETDSPYLIPKHLTPRPKYNHPGLLPTIGEYVAKLKGVTIEEVKTASYVNAVQLFNLQESRACP
jgi:TatD DNase family protein